MPVVRTRRLLLRPIVPADAAALFPIRNDPDYRGCADGDPLTDVSQLRRVLSDMAQSNTAGRGVCVAIVLEGQVVGSVELFKLQNGMRSGREWSLGYGLSKNHWRQGYMSEALHALLPMLYQHGAHRVTAEVSRDNVPSKKLLEGLGFVAEGIHREKGYWGGQYHDLISYALLQKDYEAAMGLSMAAA